MIRGKCFCGKVYYEGKSEILISGICHCADCQRITGGGIWPFVGILREVLVAEGPLKSWTRCGASGKSVEMQFCGVCGSTLFGRPERWPTLVTISASSLERDIPFAPKMHVWVQDMQTGILLDERIPQFLKNPYPLEGSEN
ncbi:MAG: GFA family protein [Chlamydiota bacterium]